MHRLTCWSSVGVLALALHAGDAQAGEADGASWGTEPRSVLVSTEPARFRGLAEQIAAEARLLLEPETESWTVRLAGQRAPGAGLEANARAGLTVLVTRPPAGGIGDPSSALVRIDPVGRAAGDGSPGRDPDSTSRVVAAPPVSRTAERDLRAFAELLDGVGHGAREVTIPLDPWLGELRPAFEQAGRSAGVRLQFVVLPALLEDSKPFDLAALLAPEEGGSVAVYLPPGLGDLASPLARSLTDRGVPTFSAHGPLAIGRGALAARSGAGRHGSRPWKCWAPYGACPGRRRWRHQSLGPRQKRGRDPRRTK